MEIKLINSGKLRAIGYDAGESNLQVTFDNGDTLQFSDVGADIWRRFRSAESAWNFYRNHIEASFDSRRISARPPGSMNPLDTLFAQR